MYWHQQINRGYQIFERWDLEFHNFSFIEYIVLEFLPDLNFYKVFWSYMFDRYSSTAANVMTKRPADKGVWRAGDHVENYFFPFIVDSIIEIKIFKNTSWNFQKYSFCVFLSPDFSQTSWFSKSTKKSWA